MTAEVVCPSPLSGLIAFTSSVHLNIVNKAVVVYVDIFVILCHLRCFFKSKFVTITGKLNLTVFVGL